MDDQAFRDRVLESLGTIQKGVAELERREDARNGVRRKRGEQVDTLRVSVATLKAKSCHKTRLWDWMDAHGVTAIRWGVGLVALILVLIAGRPLGESILQILNGGKP